MGRRNYDFDEIRSHGACIWDCWFALQSMHGLGMENDSDDNSSTNDNSGSSNVNNV